MKPMEIEQASMAIIERELQVALDPEIKPIVKRVIFPLRNRWSSRRGLSPMRGNCWRTAQ